jgi:hypothetical protein
VVLVVDVEEFSSCLVGMVGRVSESGEEGKRCGWCLFCDNVGEERVHVLT